jgi:hypothetical protein
MMSASPAGRAWPTVSEVVAQAVSVSRLSLDWPAAAGARVLGVNPFPRGQSSSSWTGLMLPPLHISAFGSGTGEALMPRVDDGSPQWMSRLDQTGPAFRPALPAYRSARGPGEQTPSQGS